LNEEYYRRQTQDKKNSEMMKLDKKDIVDITALKPLQEGEKGILENYTF
jgi:hypothetical protein